MVIAILLFLVFAVFLNRALDWGRPIRNDQPAGAVDAAQLLPTMDEDAHRTQRVIHSAQAEPAFMQVTTATVNLAIRMVQGYELPAGFKVIIFGIPVATPTTTSTA